MPEELAVLRVGDEPIGEPSLPNAPLGLPIFKMAEVPGELIDARKDLGDLREWMRFAWIRIEGGHEWSCSPAQVWPEGFREGMKPLIKAALAEVPAIFAERPLVSFHVNGDESLPVQLDRERLAPHLDGSFHQSRDFPETAMNPAFCNGTLHHFRPAPKTGEIVNVGVVLSCLQPCFLHLQAGETMPVRVKALLPKYDAAAFEAAVEEVVVLRLRLPLRDRAEESGARSIELAKPAHGGLHHLHEGPNRDHP